MYEGRKKRRKLERQIADVQERIRRTADEEEPSIMSWVVTNFRSEIDRLNSQLRQLDTDKWFERAKKHHIKVPLSGEYCEYWQKLI